MIYRFRKCEEGPEFFLYSCSNATCNPRAFNFMLVYACMPSLYCRSHGLFSCTNAYTVTHSNTRCGAAHGPLPSLAYFQPQSRVFLLAQKCNCSKHQYFLGDAKRSKRGDVDGGKVIWSGAKALHFKFHFTLAVCTLHELKACTQMLYVPLPHTRSIAMRDQLWPVLGYTQYLLRSFEGTPPYLVEAFAPTCKN